MAITANRISKISSTPATPSVVQDRNGGHIPECFKGIRLRQVFITPRKARKLLGNHLNYRNLDEKKAAMYAEIMERGEWGIFPPISIGVNGEVQDGQHRLRSVCLCGKGQWFVIVNGVPTNAINHYDNGRPRRPIDALRFKYGKDLRTAPRRLQSIIQLTHFGAEKPDTILNCDYLRLYEKYHTAVCRFSRVFSRRHRHCPPALVAAFCRAWLSLSGDAYMRDELYGAALKYAEMQFDCERLNPLRLFATWVCNQNLRTQIDKAEAYLRAANAVQAFIRRKEVKRLVPAQTDPFSLSASPYSE